MAEVLVRRRAPDQKPSDDIDFGLVVDDTAGTLVGFYGHNNTGDRVQILLQGILGVTDRIDLPARTQTRQRVNIPPGRRPIARKPTAADHLWLQNLGWVFDGVAITYMRDISLPERGSPTVSASGYTEFFGGSTTSHNVPMPSTVDANDGLHVIFLNTGTATASASGFSEIGTQANTDRQTWFGKVAVGDEDGTNVDFVTSAGAFAIAHVRRVDDGTWIEDIDGMSVTFTTGTSATPDPPTHTPAWGSNDALWVASGSKVSGTLTSAPSGYSDFVNGSGGDNMGSAYRTNTASSENPGTLGGSTSSAYIAGTGAVASDTATLPEPPAVPEVAETALSGTSTDVAIPAHDAGDVLALCVAATAAVTPMEASPDLSGDGWTKSAADAEAGNASAVRATIYYKEGAGGNGVDSGEFEVTVGTWSNSIGGAAWVIVLPGRDTSSFVDDADTNTQESGTDIATPAGTASEDDVDVIRLFIFDDDLSTEADHDSDGSWSGTSLGYAEDSTPGNGFAAAVSWENVDTGAIAASTYSSNGDSDAGVAVFVAFLPGSGSTPATATPGAISAALAMPAVTAVGPADSTPAATPIPAAIPAVTLAGGGVPAPSQIDIALSVLQPSPAGAGASTPDAIAAAIALLLADPAGGTRAKPDATDTGITIPTPNPAGGGTAGPDVADVALSLLAASAAGGGVVAPDQADVAIVIPQATAVEGAQTGSVTPDVIAAALSILAASAAGAGQSQPDTLNVGASILQSVPAGGGVASPAALTPDVSLLTVTPVGVGLVDLDPIAVPVSLLQPTPAGAAQSNPDPVDVGATILQASTQIGDTPATATPDPVAVTVAVPQSTPAGQATGTAAAITVAFVFLKPDIIIPQAYAGLDRIRGVQPTVGTTRRIPDDVGTVRRTTGSRTPQSDGSTRPW